MWKSLTRSDDKSNKRRLFTNLTCWLTTQLPKLITCHLNKCEYWISACRRIPLFEDQIKFHHNLDKFEHLYVSDCKQSQRYCDSVIFDNPCVSVYNPCVSVNIDISFFDGDDFIFQHFQSHTLSPPFAFIRHQDHSRLRMCQNSGHVIQQNLYQIKLLTKQVSRTSFHVTCYHYGTTGHVTRVMRHVTSRAVCNIINIPLWHTTQYPLITHYGAVQFTLSSCV